ncbi:MAG: hypothetical protein LIO65_00370 [Odoribacter sp.]|nr:hypothetical protein [Odoribacter sp.]
MKKISDALKHYNDKVDADKDKDLDEDEVRSNVPSLRYEEGESMNRIWAMPSLGIDPETGREVFVKKDGSLTNIWSSAD